MVVMISSFSEAASSLLGWSYPHLSWFQHFPWGAPVLFGMMGRVLWGNSGIFGTCNGESLEKTCMIILRNFYFYLLLFCFFFVLLFKFLLVLVLLLLLHSRGFQSEKQQWNHRHYIERTHKQMQQTCIPLCNDAILTTWPSHHCWCRRHWDQ